jgi:DNA repair exonuclease SbcCD nuclease subunit
MPQKNGNIAIAIVCSDWHLSISPPVWRSAEKDWFSAMERPLKEICNLSEKLECPIICAGDVFDRWNSPPELINWIIQFFNNRRNRPTIYAIPGQHDMPLHNMKKLKKSAYYTLILSGIIQPLSSIPLEIKSNVKITGFGYGKKITKPHNTDCVNISVIHEYNWIDGKGYKDAENKSKIGKHRKELLQYNTVIIGDNHKGFFTKINKTNIFNCGSLMRLHSDQKDYKPRIGILNENGKVDPYYLNISEDLFLETEIKHKEDTEETEKSLIRFFSEMKKLGHSTLDFVQALKYRIEKEDVTKPVKKIIQKIIEESA